MSQSKRRRSKGTTSRPSPTDRGREDSSLNDICLEYSFEELKIATDNFSEASKLGSGHKNFQLAKFWRMEMNICRIELIRYVFESGH